MTGCVGWTGAEVDRATKKRWDAAQHRLRMPPPRRRGAALAGERRGGRSGDEGRSDAAARRLRERPRRRGAAVAGKGAEVDRAKEDGWTPLIIACHQGHVDAGAAVAGEWRGGRPSG